MTKNSLYSSILWILLSSLKGIKITVSVNYLDPAWKLKGKNTDEFAP